MRLRQSENSRLGGESTGPSLATDVVDVLLGAEEETTDGGAAGAVGVALVECAALSVDRVDGFDGCNRQGVGAYTSS